MTQQKINALGLTFRAERKKQIDFLFGKKRYWIQIGIWVSLLIYFSLNKEYLQLIKDGVGNIQNKYFDNSLFNYALPIAFVLSIAINYFFQLIVIPYAKWKMQRRWIWISIITFIGLYFLFLIIIGFISFVTSFNVSKELYWVMILSIFLTFLITLFFPAIFYFLDIYDKQKSFKKYQFAYEERLEAENKFLSAQINPHFLFNTLNNIYALILHNEPESEIALQKLEGLISYIHNENQEERISLSAEIEFIKNYLTLEKLRNKDQKVSVVFEIDGNVQQAMIAPLILIAFIENAFKHGVNKNEKNTTIRIRIDVQNDIIHFNIFNNKTQSNITDLNKNIGGIGMNNVKRRLAISYPGRHTLKIINNKKSYNLRLTLQDSKR